LIFAVGNFGGNSENSGELSRRIGFPHGWIAYTKYDHFSRKKMVWLRECKPSERPIQGHPAAQHIWPWQRVPLRKSLNATAQYNVDWDSSPAAGRERADKTLLLTLGYSW
jgi:hypothetical protein